MWKNSRLSLVYPTYREKDSICAATIAAAETGYVDEIIVVNNNAENGTSEEVARAAAIVSDRGLQVQVLEVFEEVQGYGAACLRGLDEATGDLKCISEPDATFLADDIVKLLAYADQCDVVFGTRTVRTFIWSGANMGRFLRWGNWAVAKLLEVLFNTVSLSDVGCTMRLVKQSSYAAMRKHLTITGSFFGPQMILVSSLMSAPIVQVPVNYRPRVGTSSVTGDFWKALRLGMIMIFLIFAYRIGGLRSAGLFEQYGPPRKES